MENFDRIDNAMADIAVAAGDIRTAWAYWQRSENGDAEAVFDALRLAEDLQHFAKKLREAVEAK